MSGEVELIPFGKYKGMPVEAIMEDRAYTDWLTAQAWFREKFQNLYITIQNGGAQSEMTPEHNQMQAKFLDEQYVEKLLRKVISFTKHKNDVDEICKSISYSKIEFEFIGWDVAVHFSVPESCKQNDGTIFTYCDRRWLGLELKPVISDDFPAILRQVKTRQSGRECWRVVVCDKFDECSAVSLDAVKKMFNSSGIVLLVSSEFE